MAGQEWKWKMIPYLLIGGVLACFIVWIFGEAVVYAIERFDEWMDVETDYGQTGS